MNIRTITFAGSILAISLGWLTGSALGAYSPAEAIDLCNIESPWHMGPGANTVYDYDDGDDEARLQDHLEALVARTLGLRGPRLWRARLDLAPLATRIRLALRAQM